MTSLNNGECRRMADLFGFFASELTTADEAFTDPDAAPYAGRIISTLKGVAKKLAAEFEARDKHWQDQLNEMSKEYDE